MGPIIIALNNSATVYVPIAEAAPGLPRVDAPATLPREGLFGPQAAGDSHSYRIWQKTDLAGGPAGKYLIDDSGRAVWYVDPGINGTHTKRPDGSEVRKFDAPKAMLLSYIIKGILSRQLPWALVLLGVMISLTLELCGVPSLAFAVGVYLPLSTSSPIWIGGLVRWAIDVHHRRKFRDANLSAEQLTAEGDKSPGVLLASGYIAGGAIAGILIAFLAGVMATMDNRIDRWSSLHNPFYQGASSDALSMIPFVLLCGVLYLVGKEVMLRTRK
jgi:hypothetical protein